MIETSAEIAKLTAALVSAQGKMDGAPKDSKNPAFRSQYASLASVMEAAKPALQEAGIAFMQAPGAIVDGAVTITTMLMHGETGQWMRSTLHVPLGKRDPQGVGSAITYGLRYSLMAMLGLPPVDDDGEAAMQREAPQQQAKPASQPQAKPASKADSREVYDRLSKANRALTTEADFDKFWNQAKVKEAFDSLPRDWRQRMADEKTDKASELAERSAMQNDGFPGDAPTNGHVPPNFDNMETRQ